MRVSHEVPICLLEDSLEFNDYDYALVHLFSKYPEYYEFYKNSVATGREVILDNSLYELGESFAGEIYAEWIKKLNPTYYIIPDAFNNSNLNVKLFDEWMSNHQPASKCIAVCHGNTYEEMVSNYYYFIKHKVDKIAFSFMENAFKQFIPNAVKNHNISKSIQMTWGRIQFIKQLVDDNIINEDIPHHLLGNYLPFEYTFYKEYKWVDTIDTSSPVLAGINGTRYSTEGLDEKPTGKIIDYINKPIKNYDIIKYNINKFKEFII